jgi:hypothetical protein
MPKKATATVVSISPEPAQPKRQETKKVTIKPINMATAQAKLTSTAAYVQNKFANYKREEMAEKQKQGSSQKKTRKAKPPKDFEKVYKGSLHVSQEGWYGIPATAIRNAMIEACRLTEIDMIRAKMCIKIIKDGLDNETLEPLIKIKGEPRMFVAPVRIGINQTDLAARAIFDKWEAVVTIEWDADVFEAADIMNLLARAGWQVGIGSGRPLSKTSAGTGKGTWEVSEV